MRVPSALNAMIVPTTSPRLQGHQPISVPSLVLLYVRLVVTETRAMIAKLERAKMEVVFAFVVLATSKTRANVPLAASRVFLVLEARVTVQPVQCVGTS